MKKVQVNYFWYKQVLLLVQIIILALGLLFTWTFFSIIYKGIEAKDYTKISYAIFAANALICNCLLGFGRSAIFIDRFDAAEQKLIYFSASLFLHAAILALFACGYIYVNTDKDFISEAFLQNQFLGRKFLLISLTAALGISILCSLIGFFYFYKWQKKALSKLVDDMKKKTSPIP